MGKKKKKKRTDIPLVKAPKTPKGQIGRGERLELAQGRAKGKGVEAPSEIRKGEFVYKSEEEKGEPQLDISEKGTKITPGVAAEITPPKKEERGIISKFLDPTKELKEKGKLTEFKVPSVLIFGKPTAISQRATIGKQVKNLYESVPKTAEIATRYGSNIKSAEKTTSLLVKLGLAVGAASLLVGAIGSYPFAGFIKEEAIQSLSFGVNTAERNKDVKGMELALQQQREVLNPTAWEALLAKVPYANVLSELKGFFEASRTKLAIDEQRLLDLKKELKGG